MIPDAGTPSWTDELFPHQERSTMLTSKQNPGIWSCLGCDNDHAVDRFPHTENENQGRNESSRRHRDSGGLSMLVTRIEEQDQRARI
jgi:hypothetical protein